MATKEMSIKLMIHPESNKLIFAEAFKDFVDYLIFLLSLPIATAVKLLTESESMVGSIGNIYTSVSNLNERYLQQNINKNFILNPMFFSSVTNAPLSITGSSIISPGKRYDCETYDCKTGGTKMLKGTFCSGCSTKKNPELKFVAGSDEITNGTPSIDEKDSEGYVQEGASYIISDDLSVTAISTMSIISMMNKFKVSEPKEMIVKIGNNEALELLKASFQSTTVLTDVFLNKKKLEKGNVQRKIRIFVDCQNRETLNLDVEFSDTIDIVKSKIRKERFYHVNPSLFFGDKKLEDGRTLADYNVQHESTLSLLYEAREVRLVSPEKKVNRVRRF